MSPSNEATRRAKRLGKALTFLVGLAIYAFALIGTYGSGIQLTVAGLTVMVTYKDLRRRFRRRFEEEPVAWTPPPISEAALRSVVIHEGGHAAAAFFQDAHEDPQVAELFPREGVLAHVGFRQTRVGTSDFNALLARIATYYAGLAAELEFKTQSENSGTADDIDNATDLAEAMVCRYGMSPKAGRRRYADETFAGADKIALLDAEIDRYLALGWEMAVKLVHERRDEIEDFAEALLARRRLDADEIRAIFAPPAQE